jgi:membrane protein implicated in regulation of membrane protease activity
MNAWMWIGLAVLFAAIESFTLGLTTIWFAIGALLAFFMAWLEFTWHVQLATFLFSSLVLLYYTAPIARKYLKIGTTPTNVQALIGETAIVLEKIGHLKYGQVQVKGQIWAAKTVNNDEEIEADAKAVIDGIEGNMLVVHELKDLN